MDDKLAKLRAVCEAATSKERMLFSDQYSDCINAKYAFNHAFNPSVVTAMLDVIEAVHNATLHGVPEHEWRLIYAALAAFDEKIK